MKKIISFFVSLILLVVFIAAGSYFYISSQLKPVSSDENAEAVRIEVSNGDSVRKIGNLLKENNVIKNEKLFYIFASRSNLMKYFSKVQAEYEPQRFVLKSGIYYIKPNMHVQEIYNLLSSGRQEYISVSIPEGYTMRQIGKLLEEKHICSNEDFLEICSDTNFLVSKGITLDSAEGFLFPDTYFFIPKSSARSVAEQLIDTFFLRISTLIDLENTTNKELNDLVILASIVEKEYRVPEEAPIIASVFKNRLRRNIGLYSCATVVYVLTDIQGKPHPSRLLIEDTRTESPYNTYLYAGLTPGAISNPGLTALNAVVNAPKTNYYFFQVKDAKKGTHVFTSTFDEHIENHNLTTK